MATSLLSGAHAEIFSDPNSEEFLPLDIHKQILSWLPVETLLRFRCVSKEWRTFIDSREFVKTHLTHTREYNRNLWVHFIDSNFWETADTFEFSWTEVPTAFFTLDFESLTSLYRDPYPDRELAPLIVKPVHLDNHPVAAPCETTTFWGSCDGLLLISNELNQKALWNPSTRKYRILPVLSATGMSRCDILGIGYHDLQDDYKVLRLPMRTGRDDPDYDFRVRIYSLRSDSWRVGEEFAYYIKYWAQQGTYFNGAVHWVASTDVENGRFDGEIGNDATLLIATFDLKTEKCQVLPHLPFTNRRERTMKLAVLGDSLCTSHSYFADDGIRCYRVDIWEMKEYGAAHSWMKIVSLGQQQMGELPFEPVVPLAYC